MKRVYPPVYFLVALLFMWALHHYLPVAAWLTGRARLLGFIPIGLGMILILAGNAQFGRARTTVKPFQESSALVSGGLYTVSRNPMYLGMALILTGIFLGFGSLSPAIVIPAFVLLITKRFIVIEERMLEDRFGEAYRLYRNRVRRWI